jgi:hypothetical protein
VRPSTAKPDFFLRKGEKNGVMYKKKSTGGFFEYYQETLMSEKSTLNLKKSK